MNPRFFKLSSVLCLVLILAACTGLDKSSWPRLDEGFEIRQDPRQMEGLDVEPVEEDALAKHDEPLSAEIIELQKEIADLQVKYSSAILLISGAPKQDIERHWFSAQLELSRLGAAIAKLSEHNHSGTQAYLNDLKNYMANAQLEMTRLKP